MSAFVTTDGRDVLGLLFVEVFSTVFRAEVLIGECIDPESMLFSEVVDLEDMPDACEEAVDEFEFDFEMIRSLSES
jgi:hypothetical protein